MRICYAANSRFPSERAHMTQIVQMCNAFVQSGHEVSLLVTDRTSSIKENPEAYYGTPLFFNVVRMHVPDIAGISPGIPPILRPFAFLIQRIAFAYRASRYIRSNQFDMVYGRDEWILLILSFLLKQYIIWESHEAKFSFVARKLIARIKNVVVISEGIRDFYVRNSVPKEKIIVAHDAIDDRFFRPHVPQNEAREQLGIRTSKPVVMYIGGLDTWKGVTTLFEAANGRDVFEVYVVGGKERELTKFRNEYTHVHFLGPRPYRELPVIQQAADILVIPNTAQNPVSAEYTSPLKLFAHMTSMKPIVASRIPSLTCMLSENEAYFFTPDNPSSLRDTLVHALSGKESEKKAQAAYKKGRQFTWSRRAELILNSMKQ